MDWTKIELDKEAIVKELREQDQRALDIFARREELSKITKAIFARREELSKITKANGCYDEVWEMLFDDGKSHYSF